MKFTVAVTTYKKNAALRVFLETFLEHHNVDSLSHIVVCDDNKPTAEEVYKEFKDRFNGKLSYVGGKRAGIARNKNRGIKFFLDTEDEAILMFDDDIKFVGPGIEKAIVDTGWIHVTGYLGDYRDPLTNNPFFTTFPPFYETEDLWFCTGSQGVMLFATRQVIEDVGYFNIDWKGMYGYEHSLWSNRINRFYGYFPDAFPILKGCELYFQTQEVPNDYVAKPEDNEELWKQLKYKVYAGEGLVNKKSGV